MSSVLVHIAREYRRRLFKKLRPGAVRDPWMRYWEIEIVKDVLRALQPQRSLEWGSGYSTLRFTSLLSPDAHWLSIEHDRAWYERVHVMTAEATGAAPRSRSTAPRRPASHGRSRTGTARPSISRPTSRCPHSAGPSTSSWSMDARADCLIAAHDLVRPDGIVMLHDANRPQHHAPLALYPHQVSFFDHRHKEGGLWIGSLERDIASLIDVRAHQARWRRATRASKLLRL
jgi:hypothetical protein